MTPDVPQVLIPFDRAEAATLREAAEIAGRTPETLRLWASLHDIGRRIGGRWLVSRVALAMWLDGDRKSLRRYLDGDRESAAVRAYFSRVGVALRGES
jgi:ADP-ribose pyrophosphatase YjhB (NUDIX family)